MSMPLCFGSRVVFRYHRLETFSFNGPVRYNNQIVTLDNPGENDSENQDLSTNASPPLVNRGGVFASGRYHISLHNRQALAHAQPI